MAASVLDIENIVQIFREIVKRKTAYNETNLHYEYFKRVGDTIPYKAHGFDSLRDLIEKTAGNVFYFEKVGDDLEFIAPKKVDDSAIYSDVNNDRKTVTVVKKFDKIGNYNGSDSAKRIRVSHNIHFGAPRSTGLNNPFQNVRNDIKISFNFDAKKREVGPKSETDEMTSQPMTESFDEKSKGESLVKKTHTSSDDDEVNSGTYSSARSKIERMNVDSEDDDLPWDSKYWHLKITHAVSSNEVWARFFDEFEVNTEIISLNFPLTQYMKITI